MSVDKKNRIKKAVLTWLCVAALVSGPVPDSFSGYVPTLAITAAAEDQQTYVSEIDLQQIVNYSDGTTAKPTGVRISSGYEGYTLYIGQNGTYKLKGSNCINNSYVDVTIQCDKGINATIICDDVYIKNDNGYCGGFVSSGGSGSDSDSGGEHFSYYIPFYAALGTMTIQGNVAVETYFCQADNYFAPLTDRNVTGSFCTVTYKDANGNTIGSTHYLSGSTYSDKSGITAGKCLYTVDGEGNKTAFSPTTITAAATVICADHSLDASSKCQNCGAQFRKVTVYDGINTPSTHRVADNDTFDRPADPTAPLGKKFAGWYVGDTKYDFSKPVTSNITITAHYEDSLIKSVALAPTSNVKDKYIEGNTFDPTGLVIEVTYEDDRTETITYDASNTKFSFSPLLTTELATTDNKVTVSYGTAMDSGSNCVDIPITVAAKQVTDIAIKTAPTKTAYIEGNKFDPTGLVITASYDNGKSEDIAYSETSGITFTPTGELTTANTTVTFTYGGKTAEQKITVANKQVTDIAIKTAPTKTAYIEGEKFNPAGLVITASYNNGKSEDIAYSETTKNDFTFDKTVLATTDTAVTITYGGKTAEQAITVANKQLTDIAIKTAPTKTAYIEGNKFDPTGLVITASYDNGKSEDIAYSETSGITFTPTAELTTADTKVTFTYGGKTAAQTITVANKQLTAIAIKTAPTKTTYEIGDTLDLTGGKITVSYNNNTSVDIDITAEMISGFDSTTAGEKTVTVTYSGFTATFKVTVSKGSFTVEPTPGNVEGATIDMPKEELYDAVLTPEDKALIEQGVDIAVLMTVITINPSSVPANDVTAIENVMNDFELGCYIDVELFKRYSNGNPDVPVTDTNSPITISFKVPADILAQYPVSDYEYSVFCSHNGVGYPITCSYNAATNVMSFSNTMFSTYALAVKSRTPAAVDYTITADSHVTVQATAQAGEIVSVTVEDGYKATVTNSLDAVITTITGTGSFVMPESNVTITSELINTHVHDYSTEWKTDSTSHWYECECGDRVNVAAHVSNGGIVTVRPTETTEGVRTYSCSICGYVMRTETIPTLDPDHSHSYGAEWKSDSTSHWHECDCGEKVDIASHISDNGVVTLQPTETSEGIMTYSCSICGYILRTETIPASVPEHTHSYSTEWKTDSTSHWHECSCGDKTDIGQHISNGGIVTVQPTATSTGLRVYSCSVCGYVLRTETIPATGYNYPSYPTYPTYPTYPFDSSIFNIVTFTDKVNITAETEGNTVTIKWDKVEKADKYYVYQYKNGKYVKVKTTSDTSATFKKLKNGETYKFLIRYTKSGRLSPTKYSGTISVKVYYKPIPKPTATKNSIKLTWEAVPEAEKYAIYKYVDGKAVKLTETKKLSVKIGKLIPDTEYKYIVRAYVDGKWTTMLKSDIVTVKTTAE